MLGFHSPRRCRRAAAVGPRGRSDRHAVSLRHRLAHAKAQGSRNPQGQPGGSADRADHPPETIEQFAIRAAEAWKIGRRKIDDGALLVVAKDDRKLRIEVGYGLEGSLTNVTSSRIINEIIVPKFRIGDFAGGIAAGVDRIIAVIDGEKLPAPVSQEQNPDLFNHIDPIFALFALIIVGGMLRSVLGRLAGAAATGGVAGLLAWFVAGSLAASLALGVIAFFLTMFAETVVSPGGRGGYIGGGWSGGGGSFSGGGSSDSGGFSGGGGSFGGGGASGSW